MGLFRSKGNWIQYKINPGGYLRDYLVPHNHLTFVFNFSIIFWLGGKQKPLSHYNPMHRHTCLHCCSHIPVIALLRRKYRVTSCYCSARRQCNKVAIFKMKDFCYNCVCGTFLNPLTQNTFPVTS